MHFMKIVLSGYAGLLAVAALGAWLARHFALEVVAEKISGAVPAIGTASVPILLDWINQLGLFGSLVCISIATCLHSGPVLPPAFSARLSFRREPRFSKPEREGAFRAHSPEILDIPWEEIFADPELQAILTRCEAHRMGADAGRPCSAD